ncbi:hypothetical protein EB796_016902 [Bugula neritina]|uniref:Orct n=1 Tax=Bugula neritina TaxID=10212 RepID=A0A7J7JEY1_BUGNE|nr:hypothetical protein EB796_016902 [Bugula neritina]
MQFDDILKTVGEFGKYQKTKYFLICLFGILTAFQALVSVFSLNTPEHSLRPTTNIFIDVHWLTLCSTVQTPGNLSPPEHLQLIEKYIPTDESGKFSKCEIFNSEGNKTECDRWVYDQTELKSTVVTDLNLVCGNTFKATASSSMFMFGNLAGSFLSGLVSDLSLSGEKEDLTDKYYGSAVSSIAMSFAPEYYSFTILRFFCGAFNMSLFLTGFVLGMEMIGPQHRLFVGIVIEFFWAIGFLLLIAIGYAIRIWKYIQLAISLPTLLFISYYWLLPESARWLLVKGRNAEAEQVIVNVAKTNGKVVPTDILSKLEEPKRAEKLKALKRAPRLLCRTLVVLFNWFVIAMTYYGLSLNSGNLPGSLYVNLTISAVAEVIGYSLCFLCFVSGRKAMHVVAMIIGGLAIISSVPVLYLFQGSESQKNTIFVVLNNIGKVGVTIGFAVIYFWSAEIFPTMLRNSLMGISSTFARVGSIFAPVIADLAKLVPSKYSSVLPPLIFGIFTISAGLLSLILPETTDKVLPETIAEANVFPREIRK